MNRIDRIITEVINNQATFSNLKTYAYQIERSANDLKMQISNANNIVNYASNNTANQEIKMFLIDLYNFAIALVNAIKRCISRQNLNEMDGTVSLNNVPVLANMWYAMKRGWHQDYLKNALAQYRNRMYSFRNGNRVSNNQNTTNQNITNNWSSGMRNMNIPPYTALSVLIQQYYPKLKNKFQMLNIKYSGALTRQNPSPQKNILAYTAYVEQEIRNAQGTNP